MKTKLAHLSIAGVLLAVAHLPAMAANVYVGSECEGYLEDQQYIDKQGTAFHNGTGTNQTVTCPLTRIGSAAGYISGTIYVKGNNQSITCSLHSTIPNGTNGTYKSQTVTASWSGTPVTISNVYAWVNGGAYFRCTLPNQTYILNYSTN